HPSRRISGMPERRIIEREDASIKDEEAGIRKQGTEEALPPSRPPFLRGRKYRRPSPQGRDGWGGIPSVSCFLLPARDVRYAPYIEDQLPWLIRNASRTSRSGSSGFRSKAPRNPTWS